MDDPSTPQWRVQFARWARPVAAVLSLALIGGGLAAHASVPLGCMAVGALIWLDLTLGAVRSKRP